MPNSLAVLLIVVAGQSPSNPAPPPDPKADQLVRVLYEWERAAAQSPHLLPTAFADEPAQCSSRELATARELCGPISARNMIHRYDWTCDLASGVAVLVGRPRDPALRLFVHGFRIELDRNSFRPRSLSFLNSDGSWDEALSLANLDAAAPQGRVLQASATSSVPLDDAAPDTLTVDEVLARWQSAVKGIAATDMSFRRIEFSISQDDSSRRTGRFGFRGAGRGIYELLPGETQPTGTDDASRTIVWDAPDVYFIDPDERTYDAVSLPEDLWSEDRTVGSWDRRLAAVAFPHLGWVVADRDNLRKVIDGCRWTIIAADANQVVLEARPIDEMLRREFDRLTVVLDSGTWRVAATTQQRQSGGHIVHIVKQRTDYATTEEAPTDWCPDLTKMTLIAVPPAPPASTLE